MNGHNNSHKILRLEKQRAKGVALDLCYPPKVLKDIENAKTDEEIQRILRSARKGEYDER